MCVHCDDAIGERLCNNLHVDLNSVWVSVYDDDTHMMTMPMYSH